MTFFLSKQNFKFLETNMSDAYKMVTNTRETNGMVYFDVEKVGDFQNEMTLEIVETGMDDEDTVNKLGMQMYEIYDRLLYQRQNA